MSRLITSLGKSNQAFLKTTFGFKTIRQAKIALGVESNDEAYNVMKDLFNQKIEEERNDEMQRVKSEMNTARINKKTILQALKNIKDSTKERKHYLSEALNGAFKEQYIYADEVPQLIPKHIVKVNKKTNKVKVTDYDYDKVDEFAKKMLSSYIENEFGNKLKHNNKKTSIRCFIVIKCLVNIADDDEEGEYKEFFFNAPMDNIVSKNNVKSYVNKVFELFKVDLTKASNGSKSCFAGYLKFTISTNRYFSILGKSYIELPKVIADKKACINIKNTDEMCFDWSLIAFKKYDELKSKDKNEVRHYKKYWDVITRPLNVEYPITTDVIPQYEELNNLQINVFKLEGFTEDVEDVRTCIQTVYKSNQHRKDVVNLLLIGEGDNSHYVVVKNLSRLFNSKTSHKGTKFFCSHCISKSFQTMELLEKHTETCANYSETECKKIDIEYKMPENNIMKFKNNNRKFKHPFHIVADFESTLQNYEDDSNSSTQKYQKHLQNSFGVKFCSIYNEHDGEVEIFNHSDPDEVSKTFIEKIEEYAVRAFNMTQLNKLNVIYIDEEQSKHKKVKRCEECDCEFSNDNKKVAHHDHVTGRFISSLCNKCNLDFSLKKFIPVYIHNLKGYDAHLFINALSTYGQKNDKTDVSCIPNNEERYISFSKTIVVGEYEDKEGNMKPISFEIRFLDTIAFLNSSIETLASNLKKCCKYDNDLFTTFPNTALSFPNVEDLDLMTSKGIYPYDYIDSYDRLNETQLPPRQAFYSRLYGSDCSVKDYKQAEKVWEHFHCNTLLDYHNLYLKSDVNLLADIIHNFRNACFENYKLDFCYYYTAPGLSFDAMLKMTKIELELLTEQEMYEFCESGIRGGLSQISTRHAVANNKYMKNYDESKPDSSIVYLDANNLYGWAMSQYLPCKDFQWNTEEWNKEKIMSIEKDSETGYMLEVDLHIPEHLHDYFNNYVPCPESVKVNKSELNAWQQENYTESNVRKLCCSFNDRTNYVVNYRYLQLALSLGVELVRVKRVLQFTQTDFLKKYIIKNTDLRKDAKNDFEKDFFKLMNNSVFGKTMENVRQRINFRLVDSDEKAWRVKNLNRFTIFSENLVGVHIQKQKVCLNKPVYLGQTILDDSKYLMYDFHYNFMLQQIPREDLDLCMTDTDSLLYNIRNHDIYEIMKENRDYFDLSNFPKTSDMYDDTNNKKVGKFKSETIKPITEFVGLRAKLYAFKVDDDDEKHLKCKGVKTCVTQKDLNLAMYRSVLTGRTSKKIKQNGIRSYKHQLFTEEITKVALSGRDDKVYICDDNIHTYNFGHYRTK